MKISTKGRYGLRLMMALAARYEKGVVPLREIALQENLSEKYMEQIVTLYTRGGLVRSVRGARGGYSLSRSPATISVGDILRLSEGTLSQDSTGRALEAGKGHDGSPALETLWQKLREAVSDVMDRISLDELVNQNK